MDYGMYDNTDKLLSKEFFTYSLQQWTSAQPAVIQELKSFIDTTDFNSIYCPYPDAEKFHIRTSSQYFKPLRSKPKSITIFLQYEITKPYYTLDKKYFFLELRKFNSMKEILSQQILVFRKEKDRYVYFYSTDLMMY
jgi:hypothetical protein